MIAASPDHLAERARRWAAQLQASGIMTQVNPGQSTVGGGSLPGETLPTHLLALPGLPADALAAQLRHGQPAVVARIVDDAVCFDPRTVLPDQDELLLKGIVAAVESLRSREKTMTDVTRMQGRVIRGGRAEGRALVSPAPIGFLGGVDPDTGVVVEPNHPLNGQSVAGRVLVFPTGKGSTVGSYTILRLARNGVAPAAIINAESEAIVAVGAIIADIPMVDQVAIALIRDGDWVVVDDGVVEIG